MNKDEIKNLRLERGQLATKEQRSASNPLKSVWVEASAGTGKTKVLSDRVLRLLLSGVKPQRILCLTYTKAAAVEMNTRISERLSNWSVQPDADLDNNLIELLGDEIKDYETLQKYKETARILFAVLLDTPGGIKIQTIHSFCQEVLKRFPLEAGISPYFDVLDDSGAHEALAQIQKELLENIENGAQNELKTALQYLTQNMSEYTFPKIMQTITDNRSKLIDLLAQYADIKAFGVSLSNKLGISADDTPEQAIHRFMQAINIDDIRANIKAMLCGGKTDCANALKLETILITGFKDEDYCIYRSIFLTDGNIRARLATKKACEADTELLDRLTAEAERIQQTEDLCKKIKLYTSTTAVMTIARELTERYNELKKQQSRLDYEDLILLTRNLLADSSVASWVLFKLDGGIDHILIDEAQDTSPNQWEIVKSLTGEFFTNLSDKNRTVFAVGDRKQSIYSFQGADPDKFDTMSDYFADVASADFTKINLGVSFRSSSAVLNTVNHIFTKPEVANGVIAQNETVNHIPYRAGEFGKVELWPLLVAEKPEKNTDRWLPQVERSTKISVKTQLANAIADKIKQLVAETANTPNPLHYRDFMVLVQKRRSFVDEFIRACKEKDVNISGADKLRLGEQIVVQDLISLGRFLLLPNDDLSLAEVLKSPLFSLNDDDLITLCYKRPAPLWTMLGDNPQYAEVYKKLQTLLNMLDFVRPYELYNYVLTNMNGRYKFTARMGMEIEDALDEFINQTIAYEHDHIPSLQGFIAWMGQNQTEVKRQTEQKDTDAVRLMTVHGSKGLQAPVVFLPDTVHVKNSRREQALLFADEMAYYPLNSEHYDKNCEQIKDENTEKAFAEYRRLLYVALTRAEDRLYICGFSNNEKVDERSWYELCRQSLSAIGEVEDGEIISSTTPEIITKKSKKSVGNLNTMQPPQTWLETEAAAENLLAKPYTPSKPAEENEVDSASPLTDSGNFYRRGTLIHKLLQFLPQSKNIDEKLITDYLQKNASEFSDIQKNQIKNEVLTLLHQADFADIFGINSKAEVPIIGEVGGKIISAQIDRLVILPHKIMIVDFKTNRPAAKTISDTPASYLQQLSSYAELLQKIYPNKVVETYILWTNETRLMRVS